jgi:class 3 adenylate cyclase/putative methionine-R-sulfoxide reductase with GAF domain
MSGRSQASGKPIKTSRKTAARKRGNAPKTAVRRSPSARQEAEVARLSRELHEAQEQQRATGEILGVVARSRADVQSVLDTVCQSAAQLCEAYDAAIWQPEGDRLLLVARHGPITQVESVPLVRGTVLARSFLDKRTFHIADLQTEGDEFPVTSELARRIGFRTGLYVPLMREGVAIGTIALRRAEAQLFTERQVTLLQTFADQAVIAIENARLLNELRQSLEQQTATADVLRIISSSPGELEPIFEAMLAKATHLCEAKFGALYLFEGDGFRVVAVHGSAPPSFVEARRQYPLIPVTPGTALGRVAATKQTVQISDAQAEPAFQIARAARIGVETGGLRTVLSVPMLKEAELIGAFNLFRQEVRPFTDTQIEVVTNFAAQAIIAIENARLLNELRERTQEVVKLNQQLEQRVADQVGEIERMGRLRRFLPPQVADLIVASGTEKQLESHRREITALFCDLRGFTGFSESSDPEDVMALLRDYHAAIGQIIIKYSGTLERYAGDGVMVVFNDPVPVENPALQAVLMALEMRDAIGALTETWHRWGHDIGFGIGIAHGFATLGTIGFEGRFDYAAIGTVSNVASRLCDEAKPGQILINSRVLTKVENAVTVEPVGEFALKGIRRPMMAYNVLESSPSKAN